MRTTAVLVSGIIEVDDEISLTPFIEAANALVTKHCEEENNAYTDVELELIERYLAAHIYTIRDPRAASESAGGVSASYQSVVALGFDSSHYGQMAMRLDWYGGLSALNEKKGRQTVDISWLGTEAE